MRESARFNDISRIALLAIGLGQLSLVCALDYLTGDSPVFSFFYLIPIYFVAWYLGSVAGVAFSFACYLSLSFVDGGFRMAAALQFLRNPANISALAFFVVTAVILSRLKTAYVRERSLSSHDYLTGVFNRREFFNLAEVERLRALRYGRAMTLVFIDLDNFKNVNDHFGHAAGDAMLSTVARTIKSCIRATDIIARLGGDEFILLLEETDSDNAHVIVSKLREGLNEQIAQSSCSVTASMGVVTFVVPPASVDEMVRKADELMYASKHSGGDRAIFKVFLGDESSDSKAAEA